MHRKIAIICTSLIFFAACSVNKNSLKNNASVEELKQKVILTLSNWDTIIASPDLGNQYIKYWSKIGFRGRYEVFKKNLSKSVLENIVGKKAFLSGPHIDDFNFNSLDKFGHYNPKFLTKLHKKLSILFTNQEFIENTQAFYDENLKQSLRLYYLSHDVAVNNKEIIEGYLNAISDPRKNAYMNGRISGPSFYLQESFRDFAESIEKDGYNVYEGYTSPGFWVRRSIDGTADEFYKLLLFTMKTFDPQFVNL